MATKLRKSPPVCLGNSILRLLVGRLRFSKQYIGNSVSMEDGQEFTIFRHVTIRPLNHSETAIIFIVHFKFATLSHKANKLASIIPMLLITGYPGFNTKMYAVNNETGFWQGMYQWKSKEHLEDYKKSFVYRIMNKRAKTGSIRSFESDHQQLIDYVNSNKV
jgi:hypothetical protein